MGCQPIRKPCNPFVLLQLSANNKATQCYCDENGCNEPSNQFKLIFGGYFIIILGILGIVGNCLAVVVLWSLRKKNDINIILAGTAYILRKIRKSRNSFENVPPFFGHFE